MLAPVAIIVLTTIVLLTQGDDSERQVSPRKEVSREDFEARQLEWPLIPHSGRLTCEPVNHVLFTPDSETVTYAVNGRRRGPGSGAILTPSGHPTPSPE